MKSIYRLDFATNPKSPETESFQDFCCRSRLDIIDVQSCLGPAARISRAQFKSIQPSYVSRRRWVGFLHGIMEFQKSQKRLHHNHIHNTLRNNNKVEREERKKCLSNLHLKTHKKYLHHHHEVGTSQAPEWIIRLWRHLSDFCSEQAVNTNNYNQRESNCSFPL